MNSTPDSQLKGESLTPPRRPQRLAVTLTVASLTAIAVALSSYGWRQSVLFLIGGLLGVTLYHSSFGFSSAYRKLLVKREVKGMYAQLVMLAIATILFAPVLATGMAEGAVAPVGVQGAIGAMLFGIGMQLGGGCGCGTLYTIGGGSISMLFTLFTFCLGAFWASLTRQSWAVLPSVEPISLGQSLGWISAIFVQLILLLLLAVILWWWNGQRKPEGTNEIVPLSLRTLFYGPWSLWTGAIALAVLNWITLLLSGQPWRITWGFTLWSAQLATALGWNPSSSPFWSGDMGQQVLSGGLFADVSSVMNIGIVLGAVLAAALAGRLAPKTQFTLSAIASALLGGLIMGYGALLAFGCNVSAFFSGIASTSLHGWVWIACAIAGSAIGIRLRPLFGLPN
ncbi:MAG: YeeE/YedE family protein [Hydrococcus sp. Prado102]|jgi:hypothetical protein|nr:YeeE/YedE family protein [Hydrococcus sp. Prado102]